MISKLFFFIFLLVCVFSERVILEAKDGTLEGVQVFKELNGFSGKGYVGRFETKGNKVTVTLNVEKEGKYDLSLVYYGNRSKKSNNILVNGKNMGTVIFPENTKFEEKKIGTVVLKAGKNTLALESLGSWMYVDSFIIDTQEEEVLEISENLVRKLVNKNATPSAKKLFDYLLSVYGKKILTGQVGKVGTAGEEKPKEEIDRIYQITGKKPAVWNMDFIFESNDSTWRPTQPSLIDGVLAWWKKYEGKGIMTAQWHWAIADSKGDFGYYRKETTFDIEQAMIEGTWENEKVLADIDHVSELLLKLQEANMPVIWRPLHENDGDWFWWGGNPEATAELWRMMYKRMVEVNGVNNLIWLWNGNMDETTPIECIDMYGYDTYPKEHTAQTNVFYDYFDFLNGNKMVVMSENGRLPDINQCVKEGAWWGYFQTWNEDYVTDGSLNSKELFKSTYNHPQVITMDQLPSFNIRFHD